MKIIFMGTPSFGRTIVEELSKKHEIVLVVTQPDKRVGRKQVIEYSEVKKWAIENNVEVFQPEKLRLEKEYILEKKYDIIVTAAYGQIVPSILLESGKYHAVNVHGSLLPKGRGGAPIQRSIINGDKETGITIMYMEKGMDSGDILMQEAVEIEENDNTVTLFDKLAKLGASMINECLEKIEKNEIVPLKQSEDEVTFTYNLEKEDEVLDFEKSAFLVNCRIRGLYPIGVTLDINGKICKIYEAYVDKEHEYEGIPGEIVEVNKKSFKILCGDKHAIEVKMIKPEGKNLMNVSDYLNGNGKNILIKKVIIK